MRKSYFVIVILLLIIGILGVLLFNKVDFFRTEERISSDVMLEEVARVFKLVAVEGQVSEIYSYDQYRYWDVPFLRKQALVRVKAKVSIGYDFENVEFIVNEDERTITIRDFPDPEVLSIDHDLDYYNINSGLFNHFDEEELTGINRKAKEYILDVLEGSALYDEAEDQKEILMELLETIFNSAGWTLIVKDKSSFLQG
ncbi:MAG: DUF4230 domain-containing protein [Saprospiraceae bacterium]|nr:DUF4230 domain-containing protein [Bacteroidia bacterium]NNF20382.1 DUF4230 domain-containing protein [Saprospiraceae bacterium]NNK89343.1 DUF4230 domain-containing protein [Saprospiraceae bacterium]